MSNPYPRLQRIAKNNLSKWGIASVLVYTKKDQLPNQPWNGTDPTTYQMPVTALLTPATKDDIQVKDDDIVAYRIAILAGVDFIDIETPLPADELIIGTGHWKIISATPIKPASDTIIIRALVRKK